MEFSPIDARTVLTPTGGFLGGDERGYTHSFNPAIGCSFAAGFCGAYCYARGFAERIGGSGTWGERVLVKQNAAEVLERELARAARRPREHRHHISKLRVFSASSTDPCAGRVLDVYRACLRVVALSPPARWVVQTRSPRVLALADEIVALGDRVVVSFTIETDDEELLAALPPGAPGLAARRAAFERMSAWPVRRHLAISPCLPLREPERFADWVALHATDATVDTFATGDGSGGRRTARSPLPDLLAQRGVAWRDDSHARALFELLRARMGERVGWSEQGFLRLAR